MVDATPGHEDDNGSPWDGWAARRRTRREAKAEREQAKAEREQAIWEAIRPAIQAIEEEHGIIFTAILCFDRISKTGRIGEALHVLGKEED